MKIKLIGKFMIIVMVMFIFENTMVMTTYADEKDNGTSKTNYFEKSKKKSKYTRKKIEDEKKKKTNKIASKTEDYLNEQGLFDNEINDFSDEIIEDLGNMSDITEISVQTVYCEIIENSENEETGIISEKELNDKEIDEIVAEVYYDTDISEKNAEDKNIIDKALEIMGIKPLDIYASTINSNNNKSSYMKKTVLICPVTYNNQQFYHLYYICNWIKTPENRYVDTMCMKWDGNAAYYSYNDPKNNNYMRSHTNAKMTYLFSEQTWSRDGELLYEKDYSSNPIYFYSSEQYHILDNSSVMVPLNKYATSPGGMSVSFDLVEDIRIENPDFSKLGNNKLSSIPTQNLSTYKVVDGIIVSMDIYIKKSNENKSELLIECDYIHQKKYTKVNIDFVKISTTSFGAAAIDTLKFVLSNSNCVSVHSYSESVGGGVLKLTYVFK